MYGIRWEALTAAGQDIHYFFLPIRLFCVHFCSNDSTPLVDCKTLGETSAQYPKLSAAHPDGTCEPNDVTAKDSPQRIGRVRIVVVLHDRRPATSVPSLSFQVVILER